MNWDTEIWAPCRLGEAFTLRDLGHEKEQYLYAIKADWMGHHGDAMCVRCADDLEKTIPHNVRIGAGPRPWANCWTYEAKIKITPPVWCWDMQDDTMFGLDLKPKRNGHRRKVKLDCVKIHEGRPVYRIVVEKSDGDTFQHLDSIPVLDPYFAPIWPATTVETQEVAEPAPEPVADPVAETVTNAPEPERTQENTEQTTDSENSTTVAILPSLANCPEVPNLPPGACIGGQLPFGGKYYYYVWFEEPPTEGKTHEKKAGPQHPARQTGRHEETGTPGLCHCPKSP